MVHELKLENAPACISFSPTGSRLAGALCGDDSVG
jgi:hypothetical protein